MVDADAACVTHGGAEHLEEGAETMLTEPGRREGSEAPVLAAAVEQVGRGTDVERAEDLVLTRPAMAAAGIRTDGEVGDQAYLHAGIARGLLSGGEALIGAPLQKGVIRDLVGVLADESGNVGAGGMTQRLGPGPPVPAPVLTELLSVQGFEAGVGLERVAGFGAEGRKGGALVGRKAVELGTKGGQAAARRGAPVDEAGLFERVVLGRRRQVDCRVQHVQVDTAGW